MGVQGEGRQARFLRHRVEESGYVRTQSWVILGPGPQQGGEQGNQNEGEVVIKP